MKEKMPHSTRGFTLIELMVVISIIALLASIVLASLSSASTKATIAAGEQFDDDTYHIAGDQIVGDWEFNEGSGTTINDSSGNGNTGTILGSATYTTNTPTGAGYALTFGSGKDVQIPSSSSVNFGGSAFTVSAWVYETPGSQAGHGAGQTILAQRSGCGNFNIQMYASEGSTCWTGSTSQLNFDFRATTGGTLNLCTTYPKEGQWNNIVATYDGNKMSVYENGKLSGSSVVGSYTLAKNNVPTYIGYDTCSSYFSGNIDEVRMYSKTLTAMDIRNIYAEGIARHLAEK